MKLELVDKPTHIKYFHNRKRCRLRCPKCTQDKNRRGRTSHSFTSTMSLTKHIRQNHGNKKTIVPTFEEIFKVFEEIVIALENNIELDSIEKVVEWEMLVK